VGLCAGQGGGCGGRSVGVWGGRLGSGYQAVSLPRWKGSGLMEDVVGVAQMVVRGERPRAGEGLTGKGERWKATRREGGQR
jgi:hypothetical protein